MKKPITEFQFIMLLNIVKKHFRIKIVLASIVKYLFVIILILSVFLYPILFNGVTLCLMLLSSFFGLALSSTYLTKIKDRKEITIAHLWNAELSDHMSERSLLCSVSLAEVFEA